MILTEKLAEILRALAIYRVLWRNQVQRVVHPNHRSGRRTREELLQLYRARMISRSVVQVPCLGAAAASPCYYLTDRGRQAAAEFFEDDRLLLATTKTPRADRLLHWIGIAENHLRVRQGLAGDDEVRLDEWVNEWQRYRPTPDEDETFVLHYVFRRDPPLSVSPDAAMVLSRAGVRRAFYWEIDRGTSAIPQVAASKWQGYEQLAATTSRL